MLSVKLNNDSEYGCRIVLGNDSFIDGKNRKCLVFKFPTKDLDIKKVIDDFKCEDNTKKITIDKDGVLYTHEDYCLFDGAKVINDIIEPETNDKAEVTEDTLEITLGRLTYSEKQEYERKRQIDNISELLADLLGGAI